MNAPKGSDAGKERKARYDAMLASEEGRSVCPIMEGFLSRQVELGIFEIRQKTLQSPASEDFQKSALPKSPSFTE